MITMQDYCAAHRKQQLDIWSAIESGEMQKAVDIFAAGIQYGTKPAATTGHNRTLTGRRKSGIMRLCWKLFRHIRNARRKRK